MKAQITEQVEFFSEAELESLEFVPEELEAIEAERVPDLESISFEEVAKDLEAYFEGNIEPEHKTGAKRRQRGQRRRGGTRKKQTRDAAQGKAFSPRIVTRCTWSNNQVNKKVNEIVADNGRGHHGQVKFKNNETCLHWRTGNYCIFGRFNTKHQFEFIGWGEHTGRGNSQYKVQLCDGGTTTATTS